MRSNVKTTSYIFFTASPIWRNYIALSRDDIPPLNATRSALFFSSIGRLSRNTRTSELNYAEAIRENSNRKTQLRWTRWTCPLSPSLLKIWYTHVFIIVSSIVPREDVQDHFYYVHRFHPSLPRRTKSFSNGDIVLSFVATYLRRHGPHH